jgi:hypothetical protein
MRPTITDWRKPERRREVFHDFYEFHLRHRSHPGCVYYLMPWLRERFGWDAEQALWFAFLNGNTQNPVTSLLLHDAGSRPSEADACVAFWNAHYKRLGWDTDRRHHKAAFERAVASYLGLLGHRTQEEFWKIHAEGGFPSAWVAAEAIESFGRLSSFSYLEYLRIMGVAVDCDRLFLDDMAGSRSHRNGLCIVTGLDHMDWHDSNPGFDGVYDRSVLSYLEAEGISLLGEALVRAAGRPWLRDVSYFTLESALCTYKSWHRPNRRYAGVYNDMLYDRIVSASARWSDDPEGDIRVAQFIEETFWAARADCLPAYLRLEDVPGDPGCIPAKQNHYRETGEVIMLGHEYPIYWSSFDQAVKEGSLPGAPFRPSPAPGHAR